MALPGEGFAPGKHTIEAYGRGGFRFGGISHIGSILVLPSGVHAWPVTVATEVTEANLQPLFAEAADIDLLFLGLGMAPAVIEANIRCQFRELNIRFEVMPTAAAARTYNVLVQEGRKVAAALIAVA